jgi:hypothetical protein
LLVELFSASLESLVLPNLGFTENAIMSIFIIMKRILCIILFAFGMVFFISACASNKAAVPENMSAAEMIQRAQEASDRNRYKLALGYYQALLERNSASSELVCTAEYEIAFIWYKQKKYADAKAGINALLERYHSPDAELLPQQFKRLASIVLERIAAAEKPRFPFNLFKKKTPEPISDNAG